MEVLVGRWAEDGAPRKNRHIVIFTDYEMGQGKGQVLSREKAEFFCHVGNPEKLIPA
ncbi:MAG: hypothetical protein V4693_04215 [Pseudomonadota bacterium]